MGRSRVHPSVHACFFSKCSQQLFVEFGVKTFIKMCRPRFVPFRAVSLIYRVTINDSFVFKTLYCPKYNQCLTRSSGGLKYIRHLFVIYMYSEAVSS
jgi:hypothetical protein